MAEFAESNIQATILEIEESERLGLLEKREIKGLIEKRREWEYRLARRYKSKEDFIGYVNFETKLLELLGIRRKQLQYFEKVKEIEGSIQGRVMRRLRFLTRYWAHHLDTWAVRIDFAHKIGWLAEVSIAYADQVRFHAQIESVYITWAKFEAEERGDFDLARKILLSKAPRHHQRSRAIKKEHFRLELLYVETLMKRSDEGKSISEVIETNRVRVFGCEIARTLYFDCRKLFPTDPEVFIEFYKIAEKFSFGRDLREEIYRGLCNAFNNSIPLWKLKAHRVATGVEVPAVTEKKEGGEAPAVTEKTEEGEAPTVTEKKGGGEAPTVTENEEGEALTVTEWKEGGEAPKKLLSKEKLKLTLETYDAAVKAVGHKFYETYFDELMAMLYECWGSSAHMKIIVGKLESLFELKKKSLTLKEYSIWFYILLLKPGANDSLKTLLDDATKDYPNAAPFQFEKFKLMWRSNKSNPAKNRYYNYVKNRIPSAESIAMREFAINNYDRMYSEFTSKGDLDKFGVRSNKKRQMTEYLVGVDDNDDLVAKGMRIRYLYWINENRPIRRSRLFYEKYCKIPPYSSGLHAAMIMGELTKKNGCVKRVRWCFENAVEHFGSFQQELWIAFFLFEKIAGDSLAAIKMPRRVDKSLNPEMRKIFNQLYSIVSEIANKKQKAAKKSPKKLPKSIIPRKKLTEPKIWVIGKDQEDQGKPEPAAVHLFEEELTRTYTVDQERKNFFSNIRIMQEKAMRDNETIARDNRALHPEDGSVWAEVIEALVGEKVSLTEERKEVKNKLDLVEKLEQPSKKSKKNKKQYELSDHLDPGTVKEKTNGSADELQKILDTSSTLKPEFMQETQLPPYFVGEAKAKADRKKERAKTAGPGWNDMNKHVMTKEYRRNIEMLQMRAILDPKQPFKNKDMQVVPKYFEMGTVVDSPVDFYSSRIPKKKRKRTMAEEILQDEEALSYQKRKYNEIIAKKQNTNAKKHSSGEHKAKKMKKNRVD